ncbi:MAG: two-component regulator propeller domain-containing protein, partial [Blastocatellia bacterium]
RYGGLCHIVQDFTTGLVSVARTYKKRDGLAADEIGAVIRTSDGRLWVGTDAGLCEFEESSGNRPAFRAYTTSNGVTPTGITALAEDRGHNMWIATTTGGALKLARGGFTTYTERDGLPKREIISLFQDATGRVCSITGDLNHEFISCFDGARFVTVQPRLSSRRVPLAWGRDQITFQDREGEWWASTEQGLLRFAKADVLRLGSAKPTEVLTNQFGDKGVDAVYQDSRGDVWVAVNSYKVALARWDRSTATFQTYANVKGLPPPGEQLPIAFREDRSGDIWIGYNNAGGLVRYHDGKFSLFTNHDGVPAGSISAIYPDHEGRLWIADGEGGLLRVDDPAADHPHFITYTAANGLSSSIVWCATEDRFGRIYVGTGRGVDVIEPASGTIAHYTTADGLAGSAVRNALTDPSDGLWFGTSNGVSRLSPPENVRTPSPPVFVTEIRIGGKRMKVSELGETAVSIPPLGPSENQVQIDFVAMSFATAETPLYRYKLEGADVDWTPPSDARGISYANLQPGRYRFLVTAASPDGAPSGNPAVVTFQILPPLWRRWWFLSLALLTLGLAGYSLYRFRVNRLLELERVRTRIATDLHDDMGSSLSRIAILSEALLIQSPDSPDGSRTLLSQIAETARTLIDGMSDVIWSIDPRLDNL